MYSIILFLVICLAQYGLYLWKKSEIDDYQEVGYGVANFTGLDKNHVYKQSIILLSNVVNIFKRFLWPAVIILGFINLMLSIIVGSLIHFIVNLF
jgi:hypothetical protein